MDLGDLAGLIQEINQTPAWVEFLNHLKDVKLRALLEMAEATKFEEVLALQGMVRVLDEILMFQPNLKARLADAVQEKEINGRRD